MADDVDSPNWQDVFGHGELAKKLNDSHHHVLTGILMIKSHDRPWYDGKWHELYEKKKSTYHLW